MHASISSCSRFTARGRLKLFTLKPNIKKRGILRRPISTLQQHLQHPAQDQLVAIRATAEPVRAKLGLSTARRPPVQARELAALPAPLHVAYMQLAAASEAFSLGAEVTIEGPPPLLTACRNKRLGRHGKLAVEAVGLPVRTWMPPLSLEHGHAFCGLS